MKELYHFNLVKVTPIKENRLENGLERQNIVWDLWDKGGWSQKEAQL